MLLMLSHGIKIIVFKRCSNTAFQEEKLAFITFVFNTIQNIKGNTLYENPIIDHSFLCQQKCVV